jgi:hypothetical protein
VPVPAFGACFGGRRRTGRASLLAAVQGRVGVSGVLFGGSAHGFELPGFPLWRVSGSLIVRSRRCPSFGRGLWSPSAGRRVRSSVLSVVVLLRRAHGLRTAVDALFRWCFRGFVFDPLRGVLSPAECRLRGRVVLSLREGVRLVTWRFRAQRDGSFRFVSVPRVPGGLVGSHRSFPGIERSTSGWATPGGQEAPRGVQLLERERL